MAFCLLSQLPTKIHLAFLSYNKLQSKYYWFAQAQNPYPPACVNSYCSSGFSLNAPYFVTSSLITSLCQQIHSVSVVGLGRGIWFQNCRSVQQVGESGLFICCLRSTFNFNSFQYFLGPHLHNFFNNKIKYEIVLIKPEIANPLQIHLGSMCLRYKYFWYLKHKCFWFCISSK